MLERKYGGYFLSRRAARTIQTAFRQYRMNKNFERLRSCMSESRMRRIVLANMRMHFCPEGAQAAPGDRLASPIAAPLPEQLGDSFSELEDVFSKQVKSLAESIDDALSCPVLRREGGAGVLGREAAGQVKQRPPYGDVTMFIDEEDVAPAPPAHSVSPSPDLWTPSTPPPDRHPPPPTGRSADPNDRPRRGSVKRHASHRQGAPKHRGAPQSACGDEERAQELLQLRGVQQGRAAERPCRSESDLSDGDDSLNSTSNSNDTVNCSSESSSRDSMREKILTQQSYQKETRNSCDSPAFSNDFIRKRYYRIGLNLFNKYDTTAHLQRQL